MSIDFELIRHHNDKIEDLELQLKAAQQDLHDDVNSHFKKCYDIVKEEVDKYGVYAGDYLDVLSYAIKAKHFVITDDDELMIERKDRTALAIPKIFIEKTLDGVQEFFKEEIADRARNNAKDLIGFHTRDIIEIEENHNSYCAYDDNSLFMCNCEWEVKNLEEVINNLKALLPDGEKE